MTCSVPLRQLNLVKRNEDKPLCADQAGAPRTCLPPRTKLIEATVLRSAAGSIELTDKPCSEDHSSLPRSADLKRRKLDLLLPDRNSLLRSLLPDAVEANERRRLLAALPRRGCLTLGAVRRTSCRRRHRFRCDA